MKTKKIENQHNFVFNENQNGGEQLMLTTTFHKNGDPITDTTGIYITHELTLCSYGNSATFNLSECFTPDNLRKLANELESARNKLTN